MRRAYEEIKVDLVEAATAAGTTAITSTVVDLQDYDGVLFVTTAGTITSGGVQSIKVQEGDDSAMGDAADVTGLAITVADDDDGQTFLLDYKKTTKRYCWLVISRATQNSAWGEVYAHRYGPRLAPVVNAVTDTVTVDHN